jgi:citronellyl-CoA synthetase
LDFKNRFNIPRIGEFYGAVDGNGAFTNILNFDRTVGTCSTSSAIVKYDIEGDNPVRGEDGFMDKVDVGETGLCLFQSAGAMETRGYTDEKATEAKLFRNVFKEGDIWFNSGDLLRDIGCDHAQFIDRLGDTFRWKGHNVSTTEVEEVINVFAQTLFSTVYGVQIPNTDGRAGMAAIVPTVSPEDFNLKELATSFNKNLPPYAVPIFLRVRSKLATTATFKLKKVKLKKEGFDLEKVEDPLYIMLPQESEYISLTRDIYKNIQNGVYKF